MYVVIWGYQKGAKNKKDLTKTAFISFIIYYRVYTDYRCFVYSKYCIL